MDDPDGCLKISVQGNRIGNHFSLFTYIKILDDICNGLVPRSLFIEEEPGDGDTQHFGGEFEIDQDLIDIDIVGLDDVGVGAVSDEVLLDLAHANDDIIEHLFHEDPFLRVDHLVVGVFYFSVDVEVAHVEMGIVLEPLEIASFECDLSISMNCTPFSFLFSSRGKFSSSTLSSRLEMACSHF